MNTKWTEGQLRAICEAGGNVLVSAAAGAGKTAVLIERILRIIKEKTDIDRLLIVTFTSAAAAELRERLYLSLQKELESGALTATQAKRLWSPANVAVQGIYYHHPCVLSECH